MLGAGRLSLTSLLCWLQRSCRLGAPLCPPSANKGSREADLGPQSNGLPALHGRDAMQSVTNRAWPGLGHTEGLHLLVLWWGQGIPQTLCTGLLATREAETPLGTVPRLAKVPAAPSGHQAAPFYGCILRAEKQPIVSVLVVGFRVAQGAKRRQRSTQL